MRSGALGPVVSASVSLGSWGLAPFSRETTVDTFGVRCLVALGRGKHFILVSAFGRRSGKFPIPHNSFLLQCVTQSGIRKDKLQVYDVFGPQLDLKNITTT